MRFTELQIENFLSWDGHWVLPLENQGVLLVSGPNGAGKSSLTGKAICWVLFGETPGGLKSDAVMNVRHPEQPTVARVSLQIGDEKVTISRGRNPNLLEVDGLAYRRPSSTQEHINKLFGRDLDVFLSADYFGQDRSIDFVRSTPRVQLEVLEGILRLSRLDELADKARRLGDAVDKEVSDAGAALKHTQGQLQQAQQQINQCQARRAEAATQLRGLEAQLATVRESVDRQQLLKDLKADVERLATDLQKAEAKYQDQKWNQDVIHGQLRELRPQLRTVLDRVCPTCAQPVDLELTRALQGEQLRIQEQVQRLEALVASPSDGEVRTLRAQLTEAQAHLRDVQADLDIEEVELHQAIREKNIILTVLERQEVYGEKEKRDLDRRAARLMEEISEKSKRRSNLRFWQDTFGRSFKNFIVNEALPFLQERTAHHLALLNNPDLEVRFSTTKTLKSGDERNLFNVVACRRQGGQTYESLSGGEKQIASFAVGLALSELADAQSGSPSNLMILDEPFTELDDKNCQNVVHYVTQELVKRKETVLLISNDDRMKSLIPKCLLVERDANGVSTVQVVDGG